nr:xylosidase/arabinosidase [uncultured bacterium]
MRDYLSEAGALVSRMTLEEKVSQMLHGAAAVERLGIPSYNWWNEALHGVARSGVATVFPQAIAMAASFDTMLIAAVAEAISDEGRAKYHAYQAEGDHDIYKGLTFWSPNINIFRDPRWGRGHETYGEDPYLTARMGVAFIKNLQGDDPDRMKAAACAKHFAVHSGPESERHSFNAVVDEYDLWNTYLPAFEAAVKEAGVEAVMGAYNRTNGEPCCGSKTLLIDILREKWGFTGHVTSDCWAIADFHLHHKVTDTPVESVALAVRNGCDLNCGNLFGNCLQAVKEGLLTEEEIDRAVTRLMATRLKLGILGDAPEHRYTSIPYETVDCAAHQELNVHAACSSLVLLKNDGVLPFDCSKISTIGVIGPNADSRAALEGNYFGTASDYKTVLQGMLALAERAKVRVLYAEGCHLVKDRNSQLAQAGDRIAEAMSVARHSDAIVLCVGLDATVEGEQSDTSTAGAFSEGDKVTLAFPESQRLLMEKVREAANGKPIVVVVMSGSAMDLRWADEHTNAIMQAFYPGALGGLAVAAALFGLYSPQGKLPVTFYRSDDDLPDFRDYNMANRTYRYFTGEPLYPFGYGLSYFKFNIGAASYADGLVKAEVTNVGLRGGVKIEITDDTAGVETLQVYARADGEKERWTLCGMEKVLLKPGESASVEVEVSPAAFKRYDAKGDLRDALGKKTLFVGFGQPDKRTLALTGDAVKEIAI